MVTAYRIFLLVLMSLLLGFAFIQWLTVQPVLRVLFNHPGFLVYREPSGEGLKCTPFDKGKDQYNRPTIMFNSAGEIMLNLTNLVCHKINKDVEGDIPFTHRCKFVKGGVTE